jgi:hypothetical protein
MLNVNPFQAVIISNEIFQNHWIGERNKCTQEPDKPKKPVYPRRRWDE